MEAPVYTTLTLSLDCTRFTVDGRGIAVEASIITDAQACKSLDDTLRLLNNLERTKANIAFAYTSPKSKTMREAQHGASLRQLITRVQNARVKAGLPACLPLPPPDLSHLNLDQLNATQDS